jgi:hypothetical protein
MNWKRGLLRLWLLASLVWIGFWALKLELPCALWLAPWCHYPARIDWARSGTVLGLAMTFLSGPGLLLVAGFITLWVLKGFRARSSG